MCYKLARNRQFFKTYAMFQLNYLIRDKVVNVRLSVATTIAKMITKNKYPELVADDEFQRMAYILKNDKNRTVAGILATYNIKEVAFPDELKASSNHLFINKMHFIKEEFDLTRNLPLDARLKLAPMSQIKQVVEVQTNTVQEEVKQMDSEGDLLVKSEVDGSG